MVKINLNSFNLCFLVLEFGNSKIITNFFRKPAVVTVNYSNIIVTANGFMGVAKGR